jgi:hypothetical protein
MFTSSALILRGPPDPPKSFFVWRWVVIPEGEASPGFLESTVRKCAIMFSVANIESGALGVRYTRWFFMVLFYCGGIAYWI